VILSKLPNLGRIVPILGTVVLVVIALVSCSADRDTSPPAVTGTVQRVVPECVVFDERLAAWRQVAAGQIAFHVYRGRAAEAAVRLYNTIPPASEFVADAIAIGLMPEAPRALALLGNLGCVVEEAFIRRDLGESIVRRASGQST
jgi:hypothetical protein